MKLPKFFLFLVVTCIFFTCRPAKKLTRLEKTTFFVGTATNLKKEGIYTFELDLATGTYQQKHKTTAILNPSFLALTSDNQYLYAVHKEEGQEESQISSYAIDKTTDKLTILNQQTTQGNGACYVSVDHADQNVLVAHYGSGTVANLPIRKDGHLAEVSAIAQHSGKSINSKRQEGPHAHFIQQGFDNLIFAADLGTDKIMLYQQKNVQLIPNKTPHLELTPGAGPRHLAFHPTSNFLYVLNELNGSVTSFAYNKKAQSFKNLQTISTLPPDFKEFNKSADIHVHPSGNFLYASNRGFHDSIAAFKINPKTGVLSLIEIEQATINWPRNFAISPDGKYLLCANLNDDSISIFKINKGTGSLIFTGQKIAVPKPLCIQFKRY